MYDQKYKPVGKLVTQRIVCFGSLFFSPKMTYLLVGQKGKDQNKEPMKKKMKQTYVPCRFVA